MDVGRGGDCGYRRLYNSSGLCCWHAEPGAILLWAVNEGGLNIHRIVQLARVLVFCLLWVNVCLSPQTLFTVLLQGLSHFIMQPYAPAPQSSRRTVAKHGGPLARDASG